MFIVLYNDLTSQEIKTWRVIERDIYSEYNVDKSKQIPGYMFKNFQLELEFINQPKDIGQNFL